MTGDLPELVLLILIIAIPLALLTSVALLRLYRRAVLRGMRTRLQPGRSEPLPLESSALLQDPAKIPLNIALIDSTSTIQKSSVTQKLYSDLIRGPWHAALSYAIAGISEALVTIIIS